jgi:hypothetical protein
MEVRDKKEVAAEFGGKNGAHVRMVLQTERGGWRLEGEEKKELTQRRREPE